MLREINRDIQESAKAKLASPDADVFIAQAAKPLRVPSQKTVYAVRK